MQFFKHCKLLLTIQTDNSGVYQSKHHYYYCSYIEQCSANIKMLNFDFFGGTYGNDTWTLQLWSVTFFFPWTVASWQQVKTKQNTKKGSSLKQLIHY